jgi:hypothetical protein
MPFTHSVNRTVSTLGVAVGSSEVFTADAQLVIDTTVAAASTNVSFVATLDVSQVTSFFVVSDQNVTLETNSGTSPDHQPAG